MFKFVTIFGNIWNSKRGDWKWYKIKNDKYWTQMF